MSAKRHNHKGSDRAWNDRVGAEWAGAQPGFRGLSDHNHGYCTMTGAHVVTEVCACGAHAVYCPERRATKWVAA